MCATMVCKLLVGGPVAIVIQPLLRLLQWLRSRSGPADHWGESIPGSQFVSNRPEYRVVGGSR